MSNSLFRKKALERLESPEQLDRLITVTHRRAWLAAIGAGLLLSIAVLWAIFGRIQSTQSAEGILLRRGGVQVVAAPSLAHVAEIFVEPNQIVEAGTRVSVLDPTAFDPSDTPFIVETAITGRVLDILVRPGDVVQPGDPLLRVESTESDLEVIAYLPLRAAQDVDLGMTVQVSPVWANREEYGFLQGEVRVIERFPATRDGMLNVLGDPVLVDQVASLGPVAEVTVELTVDPLNTSGYAWSNPTGDALQVYSGTPCYVTIITGRSRPIETVFPVLR